MSFHESQHRFGILIDWLREDCQRELSSLEVLDIGCHDGTLCRRLCSLGVLSVTGIDMYETQLAEKEPWRYVQQDLIQSKALPFHDASFSTVIAFELLEHIIDTDFFLQEVHRVLKPGGLFYISTPNINMLKNRFRVPFGLYPYGMEWHTVIHHVRLYNLATLRGHLEQSGFHVKHVRGTHLLPQKVLSNSALLCISNTLAAMLPALCSNIMIACVKQPGKEDHTKVQWLLS